MTATSRLARPRSYQPGPFRLAGSSILHPDGSASAILATGELDLESLESLRRAAAVESFGRLCRTLEAPLQLLIRVRVLKACTAPIDGGEPARERAMQAHWSARLAERPAHTRSVFLVIRGIRASGLDERALRVAQQLRSAGLHVRRLEAGELGEVAADGLRIGLVVPWKEYAHHLDLGAHLIRGYVLRRLPGHPVAAGWLAPLLRVDTVCDIAVHLTPASLADALSSLGRRLRDFSAHRLLESERGAVGDAHIDVALDSAFTLRDRLARNLGRPLHLAVVACVRAPDLPTLQQRGTALRLAFDAALMRVEPTHFRHLAAFATTLPLGRNAIGGAKLVESGAAATTFPWLDAGGVDPAGYRLGTTLRSGVPFRLDPFDSRRHANANLAVLAASGQGKSFALGAVVLEAADRGVPSVVVDPEGEYTRLVAALGGVTLDLAPGGGAALNIFDAGAVDERDDGSVGAVVELAVILCGAQFGETDRAGVDAAARAARAMAGTAGRTPVLGDCLAALEQSSPRVATVIRRFCSGALGELFNRPTTVQVGDTPCNISLRDLPEEHVPAATFIVARCVWDLVRSRTRPRHIVFDEAGALCIHPPLRRLLVQLARRCRKYGASLVVATQNAEDLLATDEGRVVATNCATVLLGGHSGAETALMERAFGLTTAQRRFLETAARGEFLLLAGDRRLSIAIDVPAHHRAMLAPMPLDGPPTAPQDMGAPGRTDPKMWEN